MPSLLQVSLWYVKGLGEVWHGDCRYTNAWTISKSNGQCSFYIDNWDFCCMFKIHSDYVQPMVMVVLSTRFGSSAMTVVKLVKFSIMLWHKNVWTVNPITRDKREAEQVAASKIANWFDHLILVKMSGNTTSSFVEFEEVERWESWQHNEPRPRFFHVDFVSGLGSWAASLM